ncbi:LuxR C-terminal-related transcriptional regulator [Actinocrispum wychmicini]|uniref:DNA-binding NarL/FixJ family response regulator n=1 Tax=Actinocrispum wychmicini TaxID=1213861 RepID=A0A4V2S6H3_9PSEU|nr:response regulator transcription factor [Actinocrispum wychmicini]TCO56080.1 DNA-binding NarL/FixJ family response regulator [Actinocrispum wychmicini]
MTTSIAPADLGEVTVLVVGDPPQCLRTGHTTALHVVGRAAPGTEAVAAVGALRPDAVLLDAGTGIDLLRVLVNRFTNVPVVVTVPSGDRDTFLSAVRAGARGCLCRTACRDDLILALRVAQAGGVMFDARCGHWAVEHLTAADKPFPELTDRERDVLELVADGRATKAIARDLGLSVKTVRNYLSRIFAKLNLADRAQAAVYARRAGLGH